MTEITIKGLGFIIITFGFAAVGLIWFIWYLLYEVEMSYWIDRFLMFIAKLPIFKTKKLRVELNTLWSWIINKNKVRKRVKNFYAWCRIVRITHNHKNWKRVAYLSAFSLGMI